MSESDLQHRLGETLREAERLRAENARLRTLLAHDSKTGVRVYDYADTCVPVLRAMPAELSGSSGHSGPALCTPQT